MNKEQRKFFLFIVLFALLGFAAMQVPFSKLVGAENMRFSLFDFYGPIAGGFIGSLWGLLTVALMQLISWGVNGFSLETTALIRLLPMLFAVLYFAKKSTKYTLIVPALAMIAFWAHPEGRAAWYFAFYWLIPFVAYFFADKYLFARALGATFTQHSVGGALWLWALNMKAELWLSLIPIVWKERVLMAIGITVTYILFNYLMSYLTEKTKLKLPFVTLNPKYSVK